MKKLLFLLLIVLSITTLSACVKDPNIKEEDDLTEDDLNGIDLSKITLNDLRVTYDGSTYGLSVSNLPKGFTVNYMGNYKSEPGEYDVVAFVYDMNNVQVLTLTAKLTILDNNPSEGDNDYSIEDVVFVDQMFYFDEQIHSIEVKYLPEGFTVRYIGNDVSTVGNHLVKAEILNENNEVVLTLEAYIKIVKQSSVQLPLV